MPHKTNAPSPSSSAELIPVSELRKKLGGISRRTVGNWISRRIIPSIRIGRVLLFDLAKVKTALEKFERIEITR
jgi:excisionase family DNA binding protein